MTDRFRFTFDLAFEVKKSLTPLYTSPPVQKFVFINKIDCGRFGETDYNIHLAKPGERVPVGWSSAVLYCLLTKESHDILLL